MKIYTKIFHLTKGTVKDRFQLALIACASVFDAFVFITSLGFVSSEVRCWLLFDVFEEN